MAVRVAEVAPQQDSLLRLERPALLVATAIQLVHRNRLADAEALLRRVIERDPSNALALSCLGSVLERFGDLDGALASFERAIEAAPRDARILSNAIFAMDRSVSVTLERASEIRRRYNDLVRVPARPHPNDRDPERRLRVGYVSADFRQHSAVFGFAPVLLKHDPGRIETYVYSNTPETDWATNLLKAQIPQWRDCSHSTDDELDAMIRADQIDILVDLSGHSAGNRLPVFARKPAPVQATLIGYPTGTGLEAVDYLFSDEVLIPPSEEHHYAETVVRLPRGLSFWPLDAEVVGEAGPLPALANGYLTFGVFQRLGKLHDACLSLWARILAEVPDARLLVKAPGLERDDLSALLTRRFAAVGGDTARLDMLGSTPHDEHVRSYARVDLALDPWPDGGGISSLEAAWMGVPTLTAPWRQISSRMTASLNQELGLPRLVASTPDEYVERAVEASAQIEALADIRYWLRDLMTASAFGSHESYTRVIERHYRAFWRRFCGADASAPQTGLRLVESGVPT